MESSWQLDPRVLIFPITKPPPTSWADVSKVHGRLSRHWGLIRGLIEEQKRARKNRCSSTARLTATLFREVVARLSLSLEAVDTKDKFSCTPGVGEMIHKAGDRYLVPQVTARNPKHQPPTKTFAASAAAIVVAMRREANRRMAAKSATKATTATTVWFTEKEIRALAAPLCEEDLTHRGDEIVLGEVENFAWSSMAHLLSENKFDCVKKKDLDENATIAKLEELGRRPLCSSPGCKAKATKSMGELSERVKVATFLRSVYCKEHYDELGGGGGRKRKKATGKGKGKSSNQGNDPATPDDFHASPTLGGDHKAGAPGGAPPPSVATATGTGKIKAGWYRRLLGEALLVVEMDRVERSKGADVANGLTMPWRKEFAKNAKSVYALTQNGEWVADKLEQAIASGPGKGAPSAATASPVLNRSSYASCSERDGGGGGGTAASPQTGHSPLAPTRANGAAKPGVRLLIDNREKRGVTKNSQISELTNFLNGRGVPYEVREWKIGDYGWVVQPDAGKRPAPGEVGYEREFLVPRLLERKRVDDLAESMKDGRLSRQKGSMLRAKDEGVASEIEVHVEGSTQDGRYMDEIYRRGLTPEDLDEALRASARQGFKIVRHRNFSDFGAYLADATQALQRRFDDNTLDFESFFTWQNFIRFSKGQIPLTPKGAAAAAAAEKAAAAAKAARGGRRGRPPGAAGGAGGRGRPPLAAVGTGLRQRTLDGVFGVGERTRGDGGGGQSGDAGVAGGGAAAGGSWISKAMEEEAEGRDPGGGSSQGGSFSKAARTRDDPIAVLDDDDDDEVKDADPPTDSGDRSDGSFDDCSVLEVLPQATGGVPGAAPTSRDGGGSKGAGAGGRDKRKATPEVGSSPWAIAADGGYSPAVAAAKKVRRASPGARLLSKSAPGSSPGSLLDVEDSSSPPLLLTAVSGGRERDGASSIGGFVDRNSSRRSKRPRPEGECAIGTVSGRGRGVEAINEGSPSECLRERGGGGGRVWDAGGVSAATEKNGRSLSFGEEDDEDGIEDNEFASNSRTVANRDGKGTADGGIMEQSQRRGSGSGSFTGTNGNVIGIGNGSENGSGSGGSARSSRSAISGPGSGSSSTARPRCRGQDGQRASAATPCDHCMPAPSRPAADGGDVVDLSLDSPSPPVPPRSRSRTAMSPKRPSPAQKQREREREQQGCGAGGADARAREDVLVCDASSSDDEFAM